MFFPQDRPSNKKGTLQTILVKLWTPPPAKFYGFEFAAICSPTFVGLNEVFHMRKKCSKPFGFGGLISLSFPQRYCSCMMFYLFVLMFPTSMELRLYTNNSRKQHAFHPRSQTFGFMGSTAPQLGSRSLLTPTSQSVSSWTRSSCYLDVDNPYWCSSLWLGNLTRKMASSESLEHWAKKSDICM